MFLPLVLCFSFLKVSLSSDLYSDKVLKYNAETFKERIGSGLPHFVNFFAPWCGYCKRLKPVWDELAEKYNTNPSQQQIVIAKVDCTVETPVCAQEGVSGYPSLVFYDGGQTVGTKYQGKRDLLGLEDFISNNLGERKQYVQHLTSQSVDSGHSALELNDENFQTTVNYGMHFVKFYAPWCGHCLKMAPAWEELAENLQHDKSVTISQVDCTENQRTCADFEVKGYPTLLWIINGKRIEKYQGDRNLDGFKKFITEMKVAHKDALDLEDGRIPDMKDANLVVELSADNFENAIAQDLTFVKFFVPWCGHCKRLEPIWKDLALKFASNPHIKVAKVDCTQEEKLCSEHEIVGYPSLYVFKNGKLVTEYHGERKLEQLHSFILEHFQHSEL